MIPQTYPSTYESYNGRTSMVVYELTSVIGLQEWIDYIPVKNTLSSDSEVNTYANNGAIQIDSLSSSTGLQAWLNYIPVYQKSTGTAWLDYIPVYRSSTFTAVLTNSLLLRNGTGSPTYTRATTATVTDNENIVRPVLSGEARFQGARRVQNRLAAPENLNGSNWTKQAGAVVTQISGSEWEIDISACVLNTGVFVVAPNIGPSTARCSFSLRVITTSGDNTVSIGEPSAAAFSDFNTPVLTSNWVRVASPAFTAPVSCGIWFKNKSGQATVFRIKEPQVEVVTGQSNQAPAEYVSVGAAKLNEGTYSQQLDNATWVKSNSTVTADAAAAPDGTTAADKLVEDTATASHSVRLPIPVVNGTQYTYSVYAKAAERSVVSLYGNAGMGHLARVSLADGSVQSGSATVTAAGNGWYRIALTATASATGSANFWVELYNGAASYLGDGSSGVYLWGAQLVQGTSAGTYFPVANVYPFHGAMVDGVKYFDTTNGNSVASNVVTEASGNPISASTLLGYLAEGARTNLCLQSNGFDTTWVPLRSNDVYTGSVTAPNGDASSWKIVEDSTASNSHIVSQNITIATATTYTLSVFLKAGERTFARVLFGDTGGNNSVSVYVNLSDGAFTLGGASGAGWTYVGSTATEFNNGWWRVTLTGTSAASTGGVAIIYLATASGTITYNGDGTSGLYVFGAQVELGSFASTYIPTTTASVVRNADVLTYPFSGNASASVGSAYAEVSSFWTTAPTTPTTIVLFGSSGQVLNCAAADTTLRMFDGTTLVSKTGLSGLSTGTRKCASSYGGLGQLITGEGLAAASGAFDGLMSSTAIGVGVNPDTSTAQWFGTLRNVRIYQTQLSASQLQAVTS